MFALHVEKLSVFSKLLKLFQHAGMRLIIYLIACLEPYWKEHM